MITLMDGRTVAVSDITFDTSTYHFFYGGEDVTNLITRADKVANWSNFDVTVDNNRIFNEDDASTSNLGAVSDIQAGVDATSAGQVGTTSTLDNLTTQLTTDPLSAPLASADTLLTNSLKSWFSSYTGWLVLALLGVFLWWKFIRK